MAKIIGTVRTAETLVDEPQFAVAAADHGVRPNGALSPRLLAFRACQPGIFKHSGHLLHCNKIDFRRPGLMFPANGQQRFGLPSRANSRSCVRSPARPVAKASEVICPFPSLDCPTRFSLRSK